MWRPRDLEREELAVGAKGIWREEGQEARRAWARWETLPEKGRGPGLHSIDSEVVYPKLKHHPIQAGYVTGPWKMGQSFW